MSISWSRLTSLLLLCVSGVLAGCGSDSDSPSDGDVYVELEGEGAFYFEAVVNEVDSANDAVVVQSRALDGDENVRIDIGLCRGFSEESSVDLADSERCAPSSVVVTIGSRVLIASKGTIDVALGPEVDILVDARVDDPNDPRDVPVRVQAHLILER